MHNNNYIYVYLDPTRPGIYTYSDINISFLYEPYYIGKGRNDRYKAHVSESKFRKQTPKHMKILDILALGINPLDYVLFTHSRLSDTEAYNLEHKLIEQVGRAIVNKGPLLNYAPGGAGSEYGHLAKLSIEDMEKAASLYADGLSMEKIAPIFSVSTATINSALIKLGAEIRPNIVEQKLTDAQEQELCYAYSSGTRPKDLSISFGVCRATVTNIIKRHGIAFQWNFLSKDKEACADILERYNKGEATTYIASLYSTSTTTITSIARAGGAIIRPRSKNCGYYIPTQSTTSAGS